MKILINTPKFVLLLLFAIVNTHRYSQTKAQDGAGKYTYDTTAVDVFEGADDISFKLNYYHTEGISTGDRYWYEVIVLDSLVILNFKSPESDDRNFLSYQKRIIINDSALAAIKHNMKALGIKQKRRGIPEPLGSGYGADRLFVESKDVNIAVGTTFMCIANDANVAAYKSRVTGEKRESSSISGDYDKFFNYLERFFVLLPGLLKDMRQ